MREQIGSYRIERELGQGGQGVVYKGRHQSLGRCVAIKTLLPKTAANPQFRKRLLHEARAQAAFHHPRIVSVYEFIDDDESGDLFIVMEFVEGESLHDVLGRALDSRMSAGEALPLFDQILEALTVVHAQKIIHRDIKPSNVLICGDGVKLTDFGIALLPDATRLTEDRHIIGTRPYMSPEQLQGEEIDQRSDIYSAALVLYRMLAGNDAFHGADYLAQVGERIAGPPDLRGLALQVSDDVWNAITVALAFDVEKRFQSAALFREALSEESVGFLRVPLDPKENIAAEALDDLAAVPLSNPGKLVETTKPVVIPWVLAAGSVGMLAYYGAFVLDRARMPKASPVVARATVVPILPPIKLEEPPAVTSEPRRPSLIRDPRSAFETRTAPVTSVTPEIGKRDAEEQRGREIEALRGDIVLAITRTETALASEDLSVAMRELEAAAQGAARYPDFSHERDAIAVLRQRIFDTRVAAQSRGMWESRLAHLEEKLDHERWVEAQNLAGEILADNAAPESVKERAASFQQRAKDGLLETFKTTTVGETQNAFRKPSSPPRKNH